MPSQSLEWILALLVSYSHQRCCSSSSSGSHLVTTRGHHLCAASHLNPRGGLGRQQPMAVFIESVPESRCSPFVGASCHFYSKHLLLVCLFFCSKELPFVALDQLLNLFNFYSMVKATSLMTSLHSLLSSLASCVDSHSDRRHCSHCQ